MLIRADHYWSFVQDHIVRSNGPTAQQSKPGYLLSGPLQCANTSLSSKVMVQINTTLSDTLSEWVINCPQAISLHGTCQLYHMPS